MINFQFIHDMIYGFEIYVRKFEIQSSNDGNRLNY